MCRSRDISLADARARAAQAIELGAIMFPPMETETWPASRPLTEWLLRLMPEGGTGYVRPKWTKAAKKKLAKRFFGSPFGRRSTTPITGTCWISSCGSAPITGRATRCGGARSRWRSCWPTGSRARSWPDPGQLSKAPALLRAFIRFCHAERGIRPALTDETLAAVDEWEPEYQRVIRSPRPQGPMALLAAMGVLGDEKPWQDEPFEHQAAAFSTALAEEVGGQDALDSLDDTPLPDEEFGWDEVPADVRDRVGEVLAACDRCCDDLFGAEYRTACRRLLARAVPGLPDCCGGQARPEAIAAAVCWVIGKGNQRFGRRPATCGSRI